MAAKLYYRQVLTGGTSDALDGIDGAVLANLDGCMVFDGVNSYFYTLNGTSGAAEASPDIIKPDLNPGDKRWELQTIRSKDTLLDGNKVFIQSTEPADPISSTGDVWFDIS